MGRINKRQRLARNCARNETGNQFLTVPAEYQQITQAPDQSSEDNMLLEVDEITDYELLNNLGTADDSHDELDVPVFPIKWSPNIPSSRRYWGTARTTKLYRQKKSEEMARGSMKITSFFKSDVQLLDNPECPEEDENDVGVDDEEEGAIMSMDEALDKLSEVTVPHMNQKTAAKRQLSDYELAKYRGVAVYFMGLLDGKKKMIASQEAANVAWAKPSQHYRATAIRAYAKEYLRFGSLTPDQQGKHAKRVSLLNDEDIKAAALDWLMRTKPEKRGILELAKYLNDTAISNILGVPGKIHLTVLRNYMYEWGYTYRKHSKDVFFDGHEREDIVEYRRKWAARMMEYKKLMEDYEDNGEASPKLLQIPTNAKRIVMVTHDEATFYSNDSRSNLWLLEDEHPIRKKNPGQSIMVSEFQCPCHGTMRSGAWESRKIFYAGTNRDGYWSSKNMVEQLKNDAIRLFELLHPDCKTLFIFDQSSNHCAYSPTARVASKFGLNDRVLKEDDPKDIRSGWYMREGRKVAQSYYDLQIEKRRNRKGVVKEYRTWKLKGIRRILEERGLGRWEQFEAKKQKWKAKCGQSSPAPENGCCPFHMLQAQPDFVSQKSALQEAVERAGHIFEMYPKYHCETNWIERYWGAAKWIARRECDYSYASLRQNLPSFLDQISVPQIRRFYKRCWKYIEAYSKIDDGKAAYKEVQKFTNRRYLSHRRIGCDD